MNYYNTIFISKINKKLNKIINGIKLLNSINNTISIQSGGSGLSEAINTFAKKQLVIYNTEEYEKLVTKFLKEIAILRAIIIELLSQLHKKNQDVYKVVSMKELDKEVEAAATIIQKTFRKTQQPSQNPPKPEIKPAEEPHSVTYTGYEKVPIVFKEGDITIYNPTKETYSDFYSSRIRAPLWSKDIKSHNTPDKSFDSIYDENNIHDIYVISIDKSPDVLYLVSFKYNDLRDSTNKQLKLYILYDYIYNILSSDITAYNNFKKFLEGKMHEYIQQTVSKKSQQATEPHSRNSLVFLADSIVKYNKFFDNSFDKSRYNILKMKDNGTTYNKTAQTFGCIPFYINIYTFINSFSSLHTIYLTGDFQAQFFLSPLAQKLQLSTDDISNQWSGAPFTTMQTINCETIDFDSLSHIISLFPNLLKINVKYNNMSQVKLTSSNIISFLITLNQRERGVLSDLTIPDKFKDIHNLEMTEDLVLSDKDQKTITLLLKQLNNSKNLNLTYNN